MRRSTRIILIVSFIFSMLVSACSTVAPGLEVQLLKGTQTKLPFWDHPSWEIQDFVLEKGDYTLLLHEIEGPKGNDVAVRITVTEPTGTTLFGNVAVGHLPISGHTWGTPETIQKMFQQVSEGHMVFVDPQLNSSVKFADENSFTAIVAWGSQLELVTSDLVESYDQQTQQAQFVGVTEVQGRPTNVQGKEWLAEAPVNAKDFSLEKGIVYTLEILDFDTLKTPYYVFVQPTRDTDIVMSGRVFQGEIIESDFINWASQKSLAWFAIPEQAPENSGLTFTFSEKQITSEQKTILAFFKAGNWQ